MRTVRRYLTPLVVLLITLPATGEGLSATGAPDPPWPGPFVENDRILMVLIPRTPEQMAAFYEARGFPSEAIELISRSCFVTVHIENKGREVIWLQPRQWKLSDKQGEIRRLGSDYWDTQWDAIDLPQANRSTFGWTRLPEVRDLQPDESVGGNIVLPGSTQSFDLAARFQTGADKRGSLIDVRFEDIACPKGGSGQ
ncbi:MAG: hypothetical protein PVJ66_00075 [Gammaproteobacteria bacterium]|jgi:hypothetical protein